MERSIPSLLKHSHRLCAVDSRQIQGDIGPDLHYRFNNPIWLSRHALLAHTRLGDGFFTSPTGWTFALAG